MADSALRRGLFHADDLLARTDVRSGLLVRPDLVDERLRMVAEADSFEWHGKRRALADDCRRYNDLVSSGWTVLRFTWEQVMFDQGWVAEALREAQALCRGCTGVRRST